MYMSTYFKQTKTLSGNADENGWTTAALKTGSAQLQHAITCRLKRRSARRWDRHAALSRHNRLYQGLKRPLRRLLLGVRTRRSSTCSSMCRGIAEVDLFFISIWRAKTSTFALLPTVLLFAPLPILLFPSETLALCIHWTLPTQTIRDVELNKPL